jgi:surfactin synthase thioesterase subunit
VTTIDGHSQLVFKPWIKRTPGRRSGGATLVFPHAGGAAAAYRSLATALSANGADAFVMQYPQRADRLTHPAPGTVEELVEELFEAGDWSRLGPLRLFGHCMGAVIAFEFARVAERHGVDVDQLWVSASQAPCTVAASPRLPTADAEMVADMVDLGGTDPRLLADEDFIELLLQAVRSDYNAYNRYECAPDARIRADIHVLGGSHDHRVDRQMLQRWEVHTENVFTLLMFDGGHFYLNEHTKAVAELINGH